MTELTSKDSPRRTFLKSAGSATLTAAGVAALANIAAPRGALAREDNPEADAQLLNTALGLEYEGIGAYELAIGSGLLQAAVKETASLFQSHHQQHAEELAKAVGSLGGKPVAPKSLDDYAKSLNAAALKDQNDIIALALRLERGAAEGYLGLLPSFGDPDFGHLAARIAADETMHWTALTLASNGLLPVDGLTFGA